MVRKKGDNLVIVQPANSRFRFNDEGKAICGAINREGDPCKNPPLENGRCKYHGGSALKGTESPLFKHGRYSKYIPKGLGQIVDVMMVDPDYLEQREQIAILDAMMIEAINEWQAGGGGAAWEELNKKRTEYFRAASRKDAATMVAIQNEIMDYIASAYAKYLASKEVRETIDDRRKLTESERKRRVEEKSMLPVEQVVALLSKIGDSIRRHVSDDSARQAVMQDILMGFGSINHTQYDTYGKGED